MPEKTISIFFSFDIVRGDKNNALVDKNSVVISEELALKLFNTKDNVIGKTIEFQYEEFFTVSGIFKGTPRLSTEQFDLYCLLSFSKKRIHSLPAGIIGGRALISSFIKAQI